MYANAMLQVSKQICMYALTRLTLSKQGGYVCKCNAAGKQTNLYVCTYKADVEQTGWYVCKCNAAGKQTNLYVCTYKADVEQTGWYICKCNAAGNKQICMYALTRLTLSKQGGMYANAMLQVANKFVCMHLQG